MSHPRVAAIGFALVAAGATANASRRLGREARSVPFGSLATSLGAVVALSDLCGG